MSKSNKNRDRREVVEQMRKDAKAAERRRTLVVVAVCVVIALLVVGLAGYKVWQDNRAKDALAAKQLTDIGVAAAAAGCTPIREESAGGQGDHVTTKVIYDTVPPAFGSHNPAADDSGRHFYTVDDRPQLELLVHNLEHGWTIIWYDSSVADDDAQMDVLKGAAAKFDEHGSDPRYNLIVAPWTDADGEGQPIPEGKHIAFTHWSIHQPVYAQPTSSAPVDSFGESQYCNSFSGEALTAFTQKYPYDDAPEGYIWHQ